MKILILSFYYYPDLSAGSFRVTALVKELLEQLPNDSHIEVITTMPNRYSSFTDEALEEEVTSRLSIKRIKLPNHDSGMVDQTKAFVVFAYKALCLARHGDYHLVFGTSSRLMTAALSSYIARKKQVPLYLDVRDIFVDTLKDVLPWFSKIFLKPLFSLAENWTIKRADKVNLVSPGFEKYFVHRYPQQQYSYFTNGIDEEFLNCEKKVSPTDKVEPVVVLYAGNIGEGQGLHAIIPQLAKKLEGKVKFRILGDGGRKNLLEKNIANFGCVNVELLPPVKRDKLISEYQDADVLFLHLNDYPAFEKVLPSKLFEYAAMGKPLWVGVSGYAAKFVASEIDNAVLFHPCNVAEAVQAVEELMIVDIDRADFIEKFARKNIVSRMAADVLSVLPGKQYGNE